MSDPTVLKVFLSLTAPLCPDYDDGISILVDFGMNIYVTVVDVGRGAVAAAGRRAGGGGGDGGGVG